MLYTHNFRLASLLFTPVVHLLLALLCCTAFAGVAEAQTFIVPGTAGNNWVDTGLDIAPRTLLQFSAEGQVNMGYDWGLYGPEGTTRFAPGTNYPALTNRRYGLVARLTASRTTPHDDLREEWSYGEFPSYFAEHGGHLWLTVDDNDPANNTGYFTAHLQITVFPGWEVVCQRCPWEFNLEFIFGDHPEWKTFNGLLAFGGSITDIKESAGLTVVTASAGTVVAKYGDLPKLKIVFETNAAPKASSAKQEVIQGIRFDNDKLSPINGKAPLELQPKLNAKPGGSQPIIVKPASKKAN